MTATSSPIEPMVQSGGRAAALLVGGLLLAGQIAPPRYSPQMLRCAAFKERVWSDIRNQTAGMVRQESAGRDGILILRSTADTGGMVLEAWYDSLSAWRDSPEGRLAPDTEGLLGGRWRGRLAPDGRFTMSAAPFVPDEVAEIVELAGVLADFLPRLPAILLHPGEAGAGTTFGRIRRLANGPNGAQRYAWTTRPVTDTALIQQDTLSIPLQRRVGEEGSMEWDPVRGPLGWERRLTLTARVDPKGPIPKGISSAVNQRVRVERLPDAAQCGKGDFGSAPN